MELRGGSVGVVSTFLNKEELLLPGSSRQLWAGQSACGPDDQDVFFDPTSVERNERKLERTARVAEAKEICARCTSILPCALTFVDQSSSSVSVATVQGGMTGHEAAIVKTSAASKGVAAQVAVQQVIR